MIVIDSNRIAVLSHDFTVQVILWVIGGYGNLGRIGTPVRRQFPGIDFSTLGLELNEEGLVLLEDVPTVGLSFEFDLQVDLIAFPYEVVIGLPMIEGRVTCFLHNLR